ncbi:MULTISPECIES: ribbon-helix-helix domain-containing protein [Bacillus]|uniref:ribbon-helix-helix domain-containing protein n=1 Tax=Bacillus TaxID=1386 RepID=UPI0001A18EF9|nr:MULTISPECIES: ribbon-helix-helix domain-containing protein [Bacillus]EEM13316.1 hypothetical protein bpmyx0001_58860 [Bacillus pseudomycoides DSM 12442]KFN12947.1 hypothetical protein DJ94_4906 [Bacillus pseudomycoides]MBC6971530.1 hypothetical protein [Bacillus sp. Xin]MBJ8056206.1 hypothetical protein [Bacillus cereus]MCI0768556.1 ribbon-helix-helix domain-containing protein [Bacillus sp. TL12]
MAINRDKNTPVLVTIPNEQLEKIENFWHDNKLKSRNEAIRQLIEKGLSQK